MAELPELNHRRHSDLRLSLDNPHPESIELEEYGLQEWLSGLPAEDSDAMGDCSAG